MGQELRGRLVAGWFAHAPTPDATEMLQDAILDIDAAGAIARVLRPGDAGHAEAAVDARLWRAPAGTYVLPGFVDLHIHAPQYPQLGRALHVPLEVWLQERTFPLEARYADLAFARRSYTALVTDLLAHGTTTAVYYGTIHQDATRLLADLCLQHGQRALVGKVAMDDPDACPDYYRDASPAAAIDGTHALIDYIRAQAGTAALVRPIVTPRFIPACTDPTLRGLGELAAACGCHVQTHCSESDWQHGFVRARMGCSDTAALDGFGLLGRRSVLAHATMIDEADMALMAARGSGVAHCPLSNAYFGNAVFPLRAALARGVRVGLGTDISGGPSASMFDVARMAVAASRMLEDGVDARRPAAERGRPGSRVDFAAAWHFATAGGADVLDLPVGRFAPGCAFDALLIDPAAAGGSIRLFDDVREAADAVQTIFYTASRANIAATWVAGRLVSSPASPR